MSLKLKSWLTHRCLIIRFLSLYGLITALFLIAWTVSYFFLPEGMIRGRTGAAILAGNEAASTWLVEFLRIFGLNLAISIVAVGAASLLKNNGITFGYYGPVLWGILYGVLLGTNSFSIPLPERLLPTLAVLTRSGPYEIGAYALLAASLFKLPLAELVGKWPRQTLEKIGKDQRPKFAVEDWIGIFTAFFLLALACAWEAYQIVSLG